MRWDGAHITNSGRSPRFEVPDLHVCRGCEWPFVVPESMLDVVGPDQYLMELRCTNCDMVVVGAHGEEVLEALDRELDRQTADMQTSLELWQVTRQLEEADLFAAALHADAILPEDF